MKLIYLLKFINLNDSMSIKIGELSLSKFVKGFLGTRLIDPIEVFYLKEKNTFYPIISKSGCSTIKLYLIRLYNPKFVSKFPGIHAIDPSNETDAKVLRLYFNNFSKYRAFAKDKDIVLVIRNPYERIYSCYLDVKLEKNTMYLTPSGLHNFFGINRYYSFDQFLKKVISLPDYLSDRHFRTQTFYLKKGVDIAVNSIKVILLENFNSEVNNTTNLNKNSISLPDDILNQLKSNTKFKKRFCKDIELYSKELNHY